jgi:DHA1 family bicyclomycin/chloramphenicol resistance-like MFS transporter
MGIIFFFSSLWAGQLCVKIGTYKVSIIGTLGFFLCGVWMLLWTLYSGTSLASFILPASLSAVMGAFMLGAGAGGALEPFGHMAGTAAALLGSMQFILATIVGSFVMHWPVRSNLSYAVPLLVFGGLASLALLLYKKTKARQNVPLDNFS